MSEKFYKRIFLIGAAWNILGGMAIILFTGWVFATANLTPPHPPPYYQSWIALFMTFGLGYYMVYRDMYGNRNIVILGMIGKLAFAVIFLANMAISKGQIPNLFLIPVIGDLIFVALFWMFLVHARKLGKWAP